MTSPGDDDADGDPADGSPGFATESGADVPDPTEAPADAADREGSVTVVGTAHVSEESVAEVEAAIDEGNPDVVAVELDEGRYRRLQGEEPEDIEPSDLLGGSTLYQFLAYWMLSYVQTRLGDQFDVEPGADMMAAIDAAESRGIGVALVDRDIQVTMRRLWGRMRFREKLKMAVAGGVELGNPFVTGFTIGCAIGVFAAIALEAFLGPLLLPAGLAAGIEPAILGSLAGLLVTVADGLLLVALFGAVVGTPIALVLYRAGAGADYEEISIEDLTDTDVVTAMMEEFRRFSPGAAGALIDERDAYIAYRLIALRSAGHDVVAVVGAGHREGIERYLEHPEELPDPETLVGSPSRSRFWSILYKVLGYGMTVGFAAVFVLLAIAGVRTTYLLELFLAWFLFNGIIAAGLALLAGAHWTSAGVGGAVAWLTSVNPLLAPGWFAGYVELRYLDVSVGDISKLNDLLDDEELPIRELFGRMREVPLFRLILIVALTNLGSFIASILFPFLVLPWLSAPVGGVGGIVNEMVVGAQRSAEFLLELIL